MLDHVSIQCADAEASAQFYDTVLSPLGYARVLDFSPVIGFGRPGRPQFWIGPGATPQTDIHIAFMAENRAAVQAFFDAAVGAGAEVIQEPRVCPEYHPNYYGSFVRDPDGNNVEAVCHGPEA